MSRCQPTVLVGVLLLGFVRLVSGQVDSQPVQRSEADRDSLRFSLAHQEWEAGHSAQARELLKQIKPEQRDWVYDHLAYRFHHELRSITALEPRTDDYPRGVRHVAFSPDGKQLIAAGDDLRVKIWDAASGEKLLDIHNETQTVDYHPDGRQFFTGLSHSVSVVDAITGKTVRSFSLNSAIAGIPLRVQCSHDGKLLAASDSMSGVRVWNVTTGDCDHYFKDATRICRLSPDGSRLAIVLMWFTEELGQQQAEILVQDLRPDAEKKTPALRFRRPVLDISDLAFSPDGKQLAAACRTTDGANTVIVFDIATCAVRYELRGHTARVTSVAYSPDGRRLATAGADQTIRIWDTHTEQELFVLRGHTGMINAVAFRHDGLQCASASDDSQIKLWDLTTSPVAYEFNPGRSPQYGKVVAFAGENLVTFGYRYDDKSHERVPCLHVRNARTGAVRTTVTLPRQAADPQVTMSLAGNYLAASFPVRPAGYRIQAWDLAGDHPQPMLDREVAGSRRVAFSPDEKRLAILSVTPQMEVRTTQIEVELVESQTGLQLHSAPLVLDGSCYLTSLTYSRDGAHLAATFGVAKQPNRWQGATVLWRADTGKELAVLDEPQGTVLRADISSGGDSLVTAIDRRDQVPQGLIQVWNLRRKERSLCIEAHATRTEDVAYSPSGKLIASCGGAGRDQPGQLRFWRADSGQRLLNLDFTENSSITRLEFLGLDQSLLTLDSHGTVRLLENKLPSPEVRCERAAYTLLCELASRERNQGPLLTTEQRERLATLPLHDEVRRLALEMLERTTDDPEALTNWCWQTARWPDDSQGRYERARRLAEVAAKLQPEAAKPRIMQAFAEYRLKQFAPAWEALARADELTRGGEANLCLRAMLQEQLGKHDEAVKTLGIVQHTLKTDRYVDMHVRELFAETQQSIATK